MLVPGGAGKGPVGIGFLMLSSMKRADAGPAPFLMSERSIIEVKRTQTHCSHFRHDDDVVAWFKLRGFSARRKAYGVKGIRLKKSCDTNTFQIVPSESSFRHLKWNPSPSPRLTLEMWNLACIRTKNAILSNYFYFLDFRILLMLVPRLSPQGSRCNHALYGSKGYTKGVTYGVQDDRTMSAGLSFPLNFGQLSFLA